MCPPRNENFWDFSRNETLWWKKMGKVVNRVKLTIPSQSQPHFGGKDRKLCKITKFGHFDPTKATFLAKFAIVGDF